MGSMTRRQKRRRQQKSKRSTQRLRLRSRLHKQQKGGSLYSFSQGAFDAVKGKFSELNPKPLSAAEETKIANILRALGENAEFTEAYASIQSSPESVYQNNEFPTTRENDLRGLLEYVAADAYYEILEILGNSMGFNANTMALHMAGIQERVKDIVLEYLSLAETANRQRIQRIQQRKNAYIGLQSRSRPGLNSNTARYVAEHF